MDCAEQCDRRVGMRARGDGVDRTRRGIADRMDHRARIPRDVRRLDGAARRRASGSHRGAVDGDRCGGADHRLRSRLGRAGPRAQDSDDMVARPRRRDRLSGLVDSDVRRLFALHAIGARHGHGRVSRTRRDQRLDDASRSHRGACRRIERSRRDAERRRPWRCGRTHAHPRDAHDELRQHLHVFAGMEEPRTSRGRRRGRLVDRHHRHGAQRRPGRLARAVHQLHDAARRTARPGRRHPGGALLHRPAGAGCGVRRRSLRAVGSVPRRVGCRCRAWAAGAAAFYASGSIGGTLPALAVSVLVYRALLYTRRA